MNVLGISFGYHDSSVALVQNGKLIKAIAEERMTLQKHDYNFPQYALEHCLESEGLSISNIDHIVLHEDPHNKFSRVLCSSLYHFPFSRREFVSTVKAWLGRKLWALGKVAKETGFLTDKISYLNHHYSHAVQAFMGSGFESSAILVVDAVGDWTSTALYRGHWDEKGPKVEKVLEIAFPCSLGLVYSAVTAYLGFSPNDSECSTMALAAFGEPNYVEKARRVLHKQDDQYYDVDQSYFHFLDFYKGAVTEKFIETFGPPKDVSQKYDFSSFDDVAVDKDQKRLADIASSFQMVIEEEILSLANNLYKETSEENLCYAGGVALNCVANQRLLDEGPFSRVYIPPDPGDGGTAVGTALFRGVQLELSLGHKSIGPRDISYGPYVGGEYSETDDVKMINELPDKTIKKYLKKGVSPCKDWRTTEYSSTEEMCERVVEFLMKGHIVGWYQGRFELGPRALGNRSILVKPDDIKNVHRLSRVVKERASFRPYALSMTSEEAEKILETEYCLSHYRWMQIAVDVKKEFQDQLRAGLHIDKSTRPHVCFSHENEKFHKLLKKFGSRFGLESMINTSFNPKGYPIVSSPSEALAMFARTDMDVLVLNNTLVEKVRS